MMRVFLISIFALAISFASAQKIERYEGTFPNNQHENATANYSYYKDAKTGKKIKQGSFRYTVRIKQPEKRLYRNITGEYDKGWKVGAWNYSYTTKDYNTNNDGYFYTYSVVLEANYDNGWPQGEWNYSAFVKRRKSIRSNGRAKWEAYEIVQDIKIRLNYNHGVLVDSLWIHNTMDKSIDLLMNQQGFLIGYLRVTSEKEQIKSRYEDGFRLDPPNMPSSNNSRYDYYKKHKSALLEAGAKLDTTTLFGNNPCIISHSLNEHIFNDSFFNYYYIDGDRIISFVGNRKKMKVAYKGLYMRELSIVISKDEQALIQLIYRFYSDAKNKTALCTKQYKASNNDASLRQKMELAKSYERKLKVYTSEAQAFKRNLSPQEISMAVKGIESDAIVYQKSTRTQIINLIYSKAKATDKKVKAIICN